MRDNLYLTHIYYYCTKNDLLLPCVEVMQIFAHSLTPKHPPSSSYSVLARPCSQEDNGPNKSCYLSTSRGPTLHARSLGHKSLVRSRSQRGHMWLCRMSKDRSKYSPRNPVFDLLWFVRFNLIPGSRYDQRTFGSPLSWRCGVEKDRGPILLRRQAEHSTSWCPIYLGWNSSRALVGSLKKVWNFGDLEMRRLITFVFPLKVHSSGNCLLLALVESGLGRDQNDGPSNGEWRPNRVHWWRLVYERWSCHPLHGLDRQHGLGFQTD